MRRVYFIYVLRRMISPTFIKLYILLALVLQGLSYVSVGKVLNNTPGFDPGTLYTFYISAFVNTELIVQIVATASIVLIFWLLRDVVKKTPQSHYVQLSPR